ncbi:MAG: hypothetical protein AAF202_00365 [Pseudomonadota bacterium]
MRSLSLLIGAFLFSTHAIAATEGKLFVEAIRNIVESSRNYDGEVLRELREEILATSECIEIPSDEALQYFYKNVMESDYKLMGLKQRAIASVYFETSAAFIFCEKTESYTHAEHVDYDSIVNLDSRKDSLTVIRDRSEGTIIDEP